MKIKCEGDVIQLLGVLMGIIGFIFSTPIMYLGTILCLLRNSYDLLFGKFMPVMHAITIFIIYFYTRNILKSITYGTIIGNTAEVIITNIIWFNRKKYYREGRLH